MPNNTIIKNRNNSPIGEIQDNGSQKTAIHFKKGYVGYYSEFSDITFDKNGKIYCYGDGCSSLIREADNS